MAERGLLPNHLRSRLNPLTPLPYRLHVLRVVAVSVIPTPTPEAGLCGELDVRRFLDERDQAAMSFVQLPPHLGKRKGSFLFGYSGVERVDPAL